MSCIWSRHAWYMHMKCEFCSARIRGWFGTIGNNILVVVWDSATGIFTSQSSLIVKCFNSLEERIESTVHVDVYHRYSRWYGCAIFSKYSKVWCTRHENWISYSYISANSVQKLCSIKSRGWASIKVFTNRTVSRHQVDGKCFIWTRSWCVRPCVNPNHKQSYAITLKGSHTSVFCSSWQAAMRWNLTNSPTVLLLSLFTICRIPAHQTYCQHQNHNSKEWSREDMFIVINCNTTTPNDEILADFDSPAYVCGFLVV